MKPNPCSPSTTNAPKNELHTDSYCLILSNNKYIGDFMICSKIWKKTSQIQLNDLLLASYVIRLLQDVKISDFPVGWFFGNYKFVIIVACSLHHIQDALGLLAMNIIYELSKGVRKVVHLIQHPISLASTSCLRGSCKKHSGRKLLWHLWQNIRSRLAIIRDLPKLRQDKGFFAVCSRYSELILQAFDSRPTPCCWLAEGAFIQFMSLTPLFFVDFTVNYGQCRISCQVRTRLFFAVSRNSVKPQFR